MVKAIFLDIDGTLVSFNTHMVPSSTVEALRLVREKGIKTFVATGRHRLAINNLGTIPFDGYVTLNGGYCTTGTNKVIYKHAIRESDIDSLVRFQQEVRSYPCMCMYENEMTINYIDHHVEEMLQLIDFPVIRHAPLAEAVGREVFQLVAFFSAEEEKTYMQALPHCEATRWIPLFADVVPAGSNKQVGMDKMLAHYHIALEDTIAFGDGGNDMAMLAHAGIGIAMGNARDNVKQTADYITDSVDENGIWNALKKLGVI